MHSFNNRRQFIKSAGISGSSLFALPFLTNGHPPHHQREVPLGQWVNVLSHGVISDGKTKNTLAINELITKVNAIGGGTLYFPPGNYLTGAIHLKSNITLYLEAGATITFSEHFDDYLPMVPCRWQGVDAVNFSPLIYAYRAENITITGSGTLEGSGAVWWDYILKIRKENRENSQAPQSKWQQLFYKNNKPESHQSFGFQRPSLLQAYECRNVLIYGVRFRNSPFWTTHFVTCENVVVDSISIYNPDSPNTDGINPESSKNVRIANCHIHVDDDCVTIKSGKNQWGRDHAKPCENITVTNCVMTSGAAGVGIGSEMSAGIRKVAVSNCVFEGTGSGVHIKTVRGRGGVVEDIQIANLVMNKIPKFAAIRINMEYWEQTNPGPVSEETPRFQHIHISNVRGNHLKKAIEIMGLEEMHARHISLSQISLSAAEGVTCKYVDHLSLHDIEIESEEANPCLFENINGLDINGIKVNTGQQALSKIVLKNVKQAMVARCAHFEKNTPFIKIEGRDTQDILILDRHLYQSKSIDVDSDVSPAEIQG